MAAPKSMFPVYCTIEHASHSSCQVQAGCDINKLLKQHTQNIFAHSIGAYISFLSASTLPYPLQSVQRHSTPVSTVHCLWLPHGVVQHAGGQCHHPGGDTSQCRSSNVRCTPPCKGGGPCRRQNHRWVAEPHCTASLMEEQDSKRIVPVQL